MESLDRIVIIGASRGFGKCMTQELACRSGNQNFLLISRKIDLLEKLKQELSDTPNNFEILKFDICDRGNQPILFEKLRYFKPTQIFYCAGGGPHGKYESKNFKDHEWAFELNFLFPAKLLHYCLGPEMAALKKIIFIGSEVAENKPDPLAASYASAKHALRGLVTSVQAEKPVLDVKLFSPGYMDTELLPKNAWPRESTGLVKTPNAVAKELLNWLQQ